MIDLRNCSAQELLVQVPSDSVDLVLTDPPYIIAKATGFKNGGNAKFHSVNYDFGEWDKGASFTMFDLQCVVRELFRVTRPGATTIIWFDLWKMSDLIKLMEAAGFLGVSMIEWQKTNPVPINSRKTYLSNAREIAIVGYKPGAEPIFHSEFDPEGCATSCYQFPIYSGKDRFHTTQKSLTLFELLIKIHTDPGDLVLDCFSGSATTAVACQNTGRLFVGSELDPGYYQKSLRRLAGPAAPTAKPKRKRA